MECQVSHSWKTRKRDRRNVSGSIGFWLQAPCWLYVSVVSSIFLCLLTFKFVYTSNEMSVGKEQCLDSVPFSRHNIESE